MKKKNALFASEREKECDHPLGFPYSGAMPCTGEKRCRMCGMTADEFMAAEALYKMGETGSYPCGCVFEIIPHETLAYAYRVYVNPKCRFHAHSAGGPSYRYTAWENMPASLKKEWAFLL